MFHPNRRKLLSKFFLSSQWRSQKICSVRGVKGGRLGRRSSREPEEGRQPPDGGENFLTNLKYWIRKMKIFKKFSYGEKYSNHNANLYYLGSMGRRRLKNIILRFRMADHQILEKILRKTMENILENSYQTTNSML